MSGACQKGRNTIAVVIQPGPRALSSRAGIALRLNAAVGIDIAHDERRRRSEFWRRSEDAPC
jgi:hypothetical protein